MPLDAALAALVEVAYDRSTKPLSIYCTGMREYVVKIGDEKYYGTSITDAALSAAAKEAAFADG